jgi:hypothetical protein
VYFVFVLDIVQSTVAAGHGYAVLCNGWGRPSALSSLGWYVESVPIVSVTRTPSTLLLAWQLVNLTHAVALSCQSFYAWRIYRFGGWKVIPITILFVRIRTTPSKCHKASSHCSVCSRTIRSRLRSRYQGTVIISHYLVRQLTVGIGSLLAFPGSTAYSNYVGAHNRKPLLRLFIIYLK